MFDAIKRMFGRTYIEDKLFVKHVEVEDPTQSGWYLMYDDEEPFAGPYARERDAKGQLTRLRSNYTPASRRPRG